MQLMIVQAINVTIIVFFIDSIKRMVRKITPKFKNKARNDLTPFFPPTILIKINTIRASNSKTFTFCSPS